MKRNREEEGKEETGSTVHPNKLWKPKIDMFADDLSSEEDKESHVGGSTAAASQTAATLAASLQSVETDEGYMRVIPGMKLGGKYIVDSPTGQGVYSTVVRAHTAAAAAIPEEDKEGGGSGSTHGVVVKIMRKQTATLRAGRVEAQMLRKVREHCRNMPYHGHVARLLDEFDHCGHVCLVLEAMAQSLREHLQTSGRLHGLRMKAVRGYGAQMAQALSHLESLFIIHADLKPENVVLDASGQYLHVCDFGTALTARGHQEPTPWLVSRFYRPPEVVLGMQYGLPVDVWSWACTVYEMATGRLCFNAGDNAELVRGHMAVSGRMPKAMIRAGMFASEYFVPQGTDYCVLGRLAKERMPQTGSRVLEEELAASDGSKLEKSQLADLLRACFSLDPEKRPRPAEILRHAFFSSQG